VEALRLGVILAAGVCLVGLWLRLRHFLSLPLARDLSRARGSARRGARYALTLGMMPWAKESTRKHALSYIRGVVFHLGIFAALVALVAALSGARPVGGSLLLAEVLVGAGLVAGIIGLLERLARPDLRALSTADDYVAVLVMDLVLLAALAWLRDPAAVGWFYALAIAMLVYIPLGKIRHCIFFFPARIFFGRHFGHRGVLPPAVGGGEAR